MIESFSTASASQRFKLNTPKQGTKRLGASRINSSTAPPVQLWTKHDKAMKQYETINYIILYRYYGCVNLIDIDWDQKDTR